MAKSNKGMCSDLTRDILARLPVKSLKRFSSLSKLWYSEIKSPLFAKLHLLKQSAKPSNKFIIQNVKFSIVDMDSLDAVELSEYGREYQLQGSCNGVVCLAYKREHRILLWNIAIDDFRYIDSPSSPAFASKMYFCGFGYDALNDDYKVLSLSYEPGIGDISILEAWIYSLRESSWRRVSADFNFKLRWNMNGVFASGALHWVGSTASNPSKKSIIAFDLHKETFQEVPLPDEIDTICHIGVLESCLCGLTFSNCSNPKINVWDIQQYRIEIWVMKHHMVKESWTKFETFSNRVFRGGNISPNSGQQFLLQNSPKLKIRGMLCEVKVCRFRVENYVETLVSVNDYSPTPPGKALQCPSPAPTGVFQLLNGASHNEKGFFEPDPLACAFSFVKQRKIEFRNIRFPWYHLDWI